MTATIDIPVEQRDEFACFGSRCTVIVADARVGDAERAVIEARRRLLEWHGQFSRFEAGSELTRLNEASEETVAVSPMMRRVVQAGVDAASATGGLVDPTLVGEIERAGYSVHFDGEGLPLRVALALVPDRAPGRPAVDARWRSVRTDRRGGVVTRPRGVRIDAGGIAKGVFADELAAMLAMHDAFVVDCGGDLRLGGTAATPREVNVESPFDGSIVHTFELSCGGVATSGIGRRSWLDDRGRPAHHLLDPSTGRPAFTGVVQVTALAPTATEAEMRSKAALLSGPTQAAEWLPHGGLVVLDDGTGRVNARS
jgi:thiamine biosynthesis lipoprotein